MVQAWNPFHREWAGAWNYPAWSLSVEAFFYLSFPFLQRKISKFSDPALLLFTLAMAVLCVFGHTPTQGLGNWDQTSVYSRFLILPMLRLPEFLVGMALGNRFLRLGVSSNSSILTYLSAIAVIVLLSVPIGPWVSLVVIPFAALIYDLADSGNQLARLLSTRLMILLGGASYSVYLLQSPFRDWVRVISERALSMIAGFATPATPVLLVFFSIAVFKLWEEPSRRAIRRWFGSKASSF
jgi:peptidoglycan/LPS O-acetylase OafA/YrhL